MQPVLTAMRFPGGGSVWQGDSIHAQNAPTHRTEMRDESAKSKGKPPNCTTFVDQVVPGAYDPFELREHPGYRLRSPGQNSESVEAEEDTS